MRVRMERSEERQATARTHIGAHEPVDRAWVRGRGQVTDDVCAKRSDPD